MKSEKTISILLFLCLLFLGNILSAEEPMRLSLITEEQTIQPGRPFWVALRLEIGEHWHSYWKNPGDSGMPTTITWDLPPGLTAGPIVWPYPQRFDSDSLVGYGYEGETWLLIPMTPAATLAPDQPVTLKAEVQSLVCSDTTCLPSEAELSLDIPVSQAGPQPRSEWVAAFKQARDKLPKSEWWSLHAEKAGDQIRVAVEAPHALPKIKEAHFFPETGVGAHPIKLEAIAPNRYAVLLKAEGSESELQGVLLLRHSKGKEAIEVNLPLANEIAMADKIVHEPLSPSYEGGFLIALFLAFIGGALLNLMPCVLPVVSFKILSFVKMAGQSRAKTLEHGLAFSAGVVASFWVLAGLLLILQAYGHSVGWGFQLQEPLFIALLAALLLIFGLSLFGVFEIGTSVVGMASDVQGRVKGHLGSFFSGVLATAVATPCTGPFLGTAVGFAVTLSPLLALAIFTSVGLGMAAPYLALTAYPSLLRFLPKPGAWMVTFKELMGFLMVGTVLWLTWVFGAQTSSIGLFMLLSSYFLIALACWIYGKWGSLARAKKVRIAGLIATFVCMTVAGYAMVQAVRYDTSHNEIAAQTAALEWEPFSAERIVELQRQGTPVFVDFTAKWCLICQANHLVLSVNEVKEAFSQAGVVRMKADWTKADPAITAALKRHGRSSVPLYLYYGANPAEPPKILPQVLTPEIVLSELRKKSGSA